MWYESNCPECGKQNWVCDGDPSDLSGMDIEGLKCWNCGAVYDIGTGELLADDNFSDEGQQYPI
jgi:transcription elongation factor Elf1